MITLQMILHFIVAGFDHAGAHHASMGAVSDHLGFIETKHWFIEICKRGTRGCRD